MPPRSEPPGTRPRIVVVGSSNTDMLLRLPRIPAPGETLLGGHFSSVAGGKGANQAVAAARAGGEVSFIGRVGHDSLGDQALRGLDEDGIDIGAVVRDPAAPSGVAFIFVGGDGENCIGVAGGANAKLTASDITRAAPRIRRAGVLLAQLEVPLVAIRAAARIAYAARVPFILNPAPACALPPALLRQVSILTPNESEARALTGITIRGEASAARACAAIHALGVPTVVLTLGARGAYLSGAQGARLVPGFKMEVVDTTAAGDTFNGALGVALGEGRDLYEAIRFANAAAALSVTRAGAQPSVPRRAGIERLLKSAVPA